MKKVIFGLSGLVIIALLVILVTAAQNAPKEPKKAATEMSKDCSKCPSASVCDPAKCKEMGCDPAKCKEGKCDPATCKANCPKAKGEAKKCCPAEAACPGSAKK